MVRIVEEGVDLGIVVNLEEEKMRNG